MTAAPTSFYADPAGLSSLKSAAKTESPEALREAARQFESIFVQMMLKSMRSASIGDSMLGSQETDFYRDMHDQQLALELAKGEGMGLADLLVQQLTRAGLVEPAADSSQSSAVSRNGRSSSALSEPTTDNRQPTTSSSWPPASQEDFVRQLMPYAQQAGEELGVDPNTLIAHAALETGWGRSMPSCADGSCSFNLFGIKATGRWQGASVGVSTLEFEDGVATRRVERFRAYESPADCFRDYAALLGNSDRYAAARGTGNDAAAFATALQEGGYATDPAYASKLTAVAGRLDGLLKNTAGAPIASGGGAT